MATLPHIHLIAGYATYLINSRLCKRVKIILWLQEVSDGVGWLVCDFLTGISEKVCYFIHGRVIKSESDPCPRGSSGLTY
jgi:hypothetical protein